MIGDLTEKKSKEYLRLLYYVLARPTPVRVVQSEYLTDLSMIRQSLLFSDRKATVTGYKIAMIAELKLNDYIACIADLQLILDRLPQ